MEPGIEFALYYISCLVLKQLGSKAALYEAIPDIEAARYYKKLPGIEAPQAPLYRSSLA